MRGRRAASLLAGCLGPLALLVLALSLLAPAPALAKGPSIRGYLLSVRHLYNALEYERALAQIARARNVTHSSDDDVALSLYEGLILADLNRKEESTSAFKEALFLKPDAKLPVKVSPKVEQNFEKVRKAVKQELEAGPKTPDAVAQAPAPQPAAQPAPQPVAQAEAPKPAPVVPIEKKPEPKLEVSARAPVAPQVAPLDTAAAPLAPVAVTERRFTRSSVLIPAIGGSVLLVAGGTSWALSRGELSRLRNDDAGLTSREAVQSAVSRGHTYETVGVGLMAAGLVGLGISAGIYAFGSGAHSNETSILVGTNGTSAFVQGVWP